jgi:protein SCO1
LRALKHIVGLLLALGLLQLAWPARASDYTQRLQEVSPVPSMRLVTREGRAQGLSSELDSGDVVVLNFFFTSCSSFCSTQTATLAELQKRLAQRQKKVRFVSLSIDPDSDTPEVIRKFVSPFGIAPGWQFYTGRFDDLLALQKHFDVYRGSKAAHAPVVLIRSAPGAKWLRIEGYPDVAVLERLIVAR